MILVTSPIYIELRELKIPTFSFLIFFDNILLYINSLYFHLPYVVSGTINKKGRLLYENIYVKRDKNLNRDLILVPDTRKLNGCLVQLMEVVQRPVSRFDTSKSFPSSTCSIPGSLFNIVRVLVTTIEISLTTTGD